MNKIQIQNVAETIKESPDVMMPFNVNNIDATVAANMIYAITAARLNDLQQSSEWFDADLQVKIFIQQNST